MGTELTSEQIDQFRAWTPVDEDLAGVDPQFSELFRETRLEFASGDALRSKYWKPVEGIESFLDIPYQDDGTRAHLLDVYIPERALLRRGKALPVYIDIHGGGFTYGYKELNRNFCLHLADQGFAVFSVNYRLIPAVSFADQLEDIATAFRWIAEHLGDYPVDPRSVFITGDSAGATLGLYSAALSLNPEFAEQLGLAPCPLPIKGLALVSGLFDLEAIWNKDRVGPAPFLDAYAEKFLDQRFFALGPDFCDYRQLALHADLPPMYLCTSSNDFLEADTLLLAAALVQAGKRVQVEDWVPEPGSSLDHVFPVGLTWLPESKRVLKHIKKFSYRLIQ